jgi:hypothetical protein
LKSFLVAVAWWILNRPQTPALALPRRHSVSARLCTSWSLEGLQVQNAVLGLVLLQNSWPHGEDLSLQCVPPQKN